MMLWQCTFTWYPHTKREQERIKEIRSTVQGKG